MAPEPGTGITRKSFLRALAVGTAGVVATTVDPAKANANTEQSDGGGRPRLVPETNGVDDRAAIQAVLDEGAGDVVFSAGQNWIIDGSTPAGGLSPRSGTRIIIEDGALLRLAPNASDVSRLIDVGRDGAVQNIYIEGSGSLIGDLSTHFGTSGEWGHLIHITNGSSNVQITGPLQLRDAWGDGIYIGDGSAINYDVVIDGITVNNCRREGIAAFWVDGCTIRNCHVADIGATDRTAPASGIDCEPNSGQYVADLTIEMNAIERTAGCGIYISSNPGPVINLIIRENSVTNCGRAPDKITRYQTNGIHIAAVDNPLLTNNLVSTSGFDGNRNGASGQIYFRSVSRGTIRGGHLVDGNGPGVLLTNCSQSIIDQVVIEANGYQAIAAHKSEGLTLTSNSILDNVQTENNLTDHILIQQSHDVEVDGNEFRGSFGAAWVNIEPSSSGSVIRRNTALGSPPPQVVEDKGTASVVVDGGISPNG